MSQVEVTPAPAPPPLVHVARTKRKLAVLATPEIKQLFASEPEIRVGGFPYRVMNHGQAETALLRRLGYPAGNPMLEYYDWAGSNITPFKVQKITCDLLTLNERAYVLNDMGTGKTKAALWAWDWLKSQGLSGKLLIVCPKSTMNFVWMNEIFATIPHRKAVVLHGTAQYRLDMLADPQFEIFVINHDGVSVIFDELMKRKDLDTMVLDELAIYRNSNTRSKRMRKLAATKKIVWGMTGSPMPTAPTDVWMQASIVTPSSVPKYFSHVEHVLMDQKSTHVWVPKPGAIEKAFSYMQPAVRFNLDDVVELPDLIERNIDVAMTPEQRKVYDGIVKHCHALAQAHKIDAANAAVAMGKLLQIAGGWVYAGDKQVATLDAKPRIDALLDTIRGCSRKVIVFAPYLHALHGVSKVLTAEKIDHAVVHGGTNNRDRIFTAFQNTSQYKVLLAHPKCMSHGLTMTAANTIIWFLPVTSLETYEQANARIRRIGQKHKQEIIHLIASPVERRIYSLLRGRQKLQDKFLGLFESATALLS